MVSVPDLDSMFTELGTPSGPASDVLCAAVVPGWERYRLAKDLEGSPGLVIAVSRRDEEGLLSPIQLKHITFFPAATCSIEEAGGVRHGGEFAVIRLRSADAELRRLFLREAANWISLLGADPTPHVLASAVARLAELFQAVTRPAKETIQGLWAELFVIHRSADPEFHLRAWHSDPSELFDFSSGTELLEVKSTSGALRRHRFALRQLQPPAGHDLRIASVLIEETPSGVTVEDLAESVKARVGPTLRFRIDELVTIILGEQWRLARKARFATAQALATLELFSPATIPSIHGDLPPEVSDVRFTADLTSISPMPRDAAARTGTLFHSTGRNEKT